MRRLAALALALAAAIAAIVVLTGSARSAGGPYHVRAIFDDASFAVTGEDVRVAGANVGSITSLGVTQSKQAAVTLTIDNGDFAPFFANAHCAIRPQSLIGEEYVDCTPGTSNRPQLRKIGSGPGKGDYLLPVTRTESPVDTDIVQNISREPVRQSLSVIIDELGTGLAARGADLNAVIHRANPALGNTDQVVKILDRQDRTLAQLASSSNTVLAPLARERAQIAGFVRNANTTAVASASRAQDIGRTFRELPAFLRQLRPLMTDLGELSDQGTPVMSELGSSASSLGQEFAALTPFARSARSAITNLGAAAKASQPALVASEPLARHLRSLGSQARPSAVSLQKLLTSLDNTGGIEQLMTLLYEGTTAANGFNSLGHYVRVSTIIGQCTSYAQSPLGNCLANFSGSSSSEARRASAETPLDRGSEAVVAQALKAVAAKRSAQSSMAGLLSYLMGGKA